MGRVKLRSLGEIYVSSNEVLEPEKIKSTSEDTSAEHPEDEAGSVAHLNMGLHGNLTKPESRHCEHMAFPRKTKADEFSEKVIEGKMVHQYSSTEIELSSSSKSFDSFSENSPFKTLKSPKGMNDTSNTVLNNSSPKIGVCSNKSDLTEISSLRHSVSAKDERSQCSEEQVESSLQRTGTSGIFVPTTQFNNGVNEGDLAENCLDRKEFFVGSNLVLEKSNGQEIPLQPQSAHDNDDLNALEQEVNICDICGDLGRQELLAVCSKCKDGAEHIYCMQVNLEKLPDDWICEECMVAKEAEKKKTDENLKGESLNAIRKELEYEDESSFRDKNGLESNDKGLGFGKTRKNKVVYHYPAKRPVVNSEAVAVDHIRNSKKRKTILSRDSSFKKIDKGKVMEADAISSGGSLPGIKKRLLNACVSSHSGGSLLRPTPFNDLTSSLLRPRPLNDIGLMEKKCKASKEYENCLKDANHLIASAVPSQFCPLPQPCWIWQGGFNIQRIGRFSSSYDGIQAHLSCSASENVVELAHKLSRNINLEEVSRTTIWPTHFSNDHAIALYFFAKDFVSYERSYKRLLELMTKNDICLKGNLCGSELFILPSNTLPVNFQRWNGLFFLWGVFRSHGRIGDSHTRVQHLSSEFLPPDLPLREEKDCKKQLDGQAQKNPEYHLEPPVPNLELSLGFGGGGGASNRNRSSKPVSSYNENNNEVSLSLSLSRSGLSLGVLQRDIERNDVNTTLSLFCVSNR